VTDHDKRLLSALRPAGVVLFRDNFDHDLPYAQWLSLHRQQLHTVRQCIERDTLLVAIDHEGGQVQRTPAPITHFAAPADWCQQAGAVGAAIGRELRSLGVNLNFAPLADVHSNPDNPVIGRRAFGSDSETVVLAAGRFLDAMQGAGVLGCLKHFPGHGDTAVDSHHQLPVVDLPLAELRARELQPFAELIDRDVQLVMTAHILFPQWDAEWPATLSRKIVDGYLRQKLGFDGVVVTDDIGMQAIADRFRQPGTAARALTAGCDLIAICAHLADTNLALDLARDLAASRRNGTLEEATLSASKRRIDGLLARAPDHAVEVLPADVFEAHRAVAPVV